MKAMGPYRMVGQAVPLQYLDYEAGVEMIMTEIPGGHSTFLLNAARGAAAAYSRETWGVHLANHVTRAPIGQEHIRRLFILLGQIWLHGASVIQDEEVAYRHNHDTIYSFSDAIPEAYRRMYQMIFHYGNVIDLGTPIVNTGFLQGNYEMPPVGQLAIPYMEPCKVWGGFGPEKECWEYDTPEAGWRMIDFYMPGVWLTPVPNREKVRLFFTGSPYGQVDLVPVGAKPEKLSVYPVLYLPGWNTMTREIYENLVEYVRGGGHLILCAAQCTEHVEREFLIEKQDFALINEGDLSELAGVRVAMGDEVINTVFFADEAVSVNPGVVGLKTELSGAEAIAVDQFGKPVVVENKIGNGRVWMLCVGEYWGADALEEFNRVLCRRVVRENQAEITVYGDTADVDYYHFRQEKMERIVLLNTDWTSSQNVKYVTLCIGAMLIPLAVREGTIKHLLIKDGAAVSFEMPSAIINDFMVSEEQIVFELQGVGEINLDLFPGKGKKKRELKFSMGDCWTSREICINRC